MKNTMNTIVRKMIEENIPIEEWEEKCCYFIYRDETMLIKDTEDGDFQVAAILMKNLGYSKDMFHQAAKNNEWFFEDQGYVIYMEPDYYIQPVGQDLVLCHPGNVNELKRVSIKTLLDCFLDALNLLRNGICHGMERRN